MYGEYNLRCVQGETLQRELSLVSEADDEPIPLTGVTAAMQVRDDVTNTLLISSTTENGHLEINGSAGTLKINIPAEVTAQLAIGGFYELRLIYPGGIVKPLLKGEFLLEDSIFS